MENKKVIGDHGEDLAVRYLKKKKKYEILERNFRYKHGEIDIIAFDDPVTVFIEVRTRQGHSLVSGYFSVSQKKKQSLLPACQHYIADHGLQFFRFDVIEISYIGEAFDIFHYENVPLF